MINMFFQWGKSSHSFSSFIFSVFPPLVILHMQLIVDALLSWRSDWGEGLRPESSTTPCHEHLRTPWECLRQWFPVAFSIVMPLTRRFIRLREDIRTPRAIEHSASYLLSRSTYHLQCYSVVITSSVWEQDAKP